MGAPFTGLAFGGLSVRLLTGVDESLVLLKKLFVGHSVSHGISLF